MGAQKNRLIETVLLGTHNIFFGSETRKFIFNFTLLSKGLHDKKFDILTNDITNSPVITPNIMYGQCIADPAHNGPIIVAMPTTLLRRPILRPGKEKWPAVKLYNLP